VYTNLRGEQQNGEPVWTPFVINIDYDAKGQRESIAYGNGARTNYSYDPLTFRLVHLLTRRDATAFPGDGPRPPPTDWPGGQLQNLHYTYDPAGNITHIRDDTQQTIYFRNRRVEPSADYTYDAIYRLIEATGREHLGQAGAARTPSSWNDEPRTGILFSASDGNAMGRYLERYAYDAVGNFQEMIHRGSDPVNPGWTRAYAYDEASLLEQGQHSNRLTSTTIGATSAVYSSNGDGYDAHGNMLRMPHLQVMQWDFKDQLQMTQRQAVNADSRDGARRQGERTWYVYDASGQRVRKVTELANGVVKDERIYLGGFEIYRKHEADPLVRETLHIMDDKRRIALVETRAEGDEAGSPAQLIRYQLGNHLGSASLELDDHAQVISYEEYFPYGSTSYQAVRSRTETPKRYRYTGKERDEESGLYYHGARYYAPWLGRWSNCDPIGLGDGVNVYSYVRNNPLVKTDETGKKGSDPGKHVIRQGDTFWSLENKYHYKHGTLQALNKGANERKLQIGSSINLPGSARKNEKEKTYFGGWLNEVTIKPSAAFVAFIGGASDKSSYFGQGPYYHMLNVRNEFVASLSTDTTNTDFFKAKYYGFDEAKTGVIKKDIENAMKVNPQQKVYIVGHSLGGWQGATLAGDTSSFKTTMLVTLDPVGTRARLLGDVSFAKPQPKADKWINILAQPSTSDGSSDAVANLGGRWHIAQGPSRLDTANLHHVEALELMQFTPSNDTSAWDLLKTNVESNLKWLNNLQQK
jgi:RHS repeat-associated protein